LDYVEAHGFSRGNQGIKSEAALEAAEKDEYSVVLKGRGFSRAVMALYFQYPERASAREGSVLGWIRRLFPQPV
jgi:hypothetical protein